MRGPPTEGADGLVTVAEVVAASKRIDEVAVRTPLVPFPTLSERVGTEIRGKLESLQRAGSFKTRGAANFLATADPGAVAKGVITYSSGNHGQAVALAARVRGVPATVVMPTTAPQVKRAGAERLGARVIFEGSTSIERKGRAEVIAAEEGLLMVPPFDDPAIIAGQGTVGLEIAEEWPDVELVVVPIGGGGLASGVGVAMKALREGCAVVGVEPAGAASMRAAIDQGGPVTLDSIDTIADGLAPVRAGDLTFRHVSRLLDDVVLVRDESIREAAQRLLTEARIVVEYSGGAALAALLSGELAAEGRRTAVVVSGGNLDPAILRTFV